MNKDSMNMLSFILGNQSKIYTKGNAQNKKINRNLIMSSAMFWDSKKRVQKIKTLFLNNMGLIQFDSTQDFQIQQLVSIQLLSISKNSIIHLQPLSNLQTLLSLNISHNKVYDLNPLIRLKRLQQLYASNNSIKSIEALQTLDKLKILQLYKNRVQNQQQVFKTVQKLIKLQEIDLGQNKVCQNQQFVLVLQSFSYLKKVNHKLNKNTQKIKQMSSSKGFNNSKTFSNSKALNNSKIFGATSMMFKTNQSIVIDAKTTFYNFNKKKNGGKSIQKIRQKQNILQKLQTHYNELDNQFEQQIIKNVSLKSRLYKLIQQKRAEQNQRQDLQYEAQQISQMKRKVKALKQQLFSKDTKGQLLRKIFEVETSLSQPIQQVNQQTKTIKDKQIQDNSNSTILWMRKFQADQVIIIKEQTNSNNQDQELNDMLNGFQKSIQQIKDDMDYFS